MARSAAILLVTLLLTGCGAVTQIICKGANPALARPVATVVPLGAAVDWAKVQSSPRYGQFFLDHYQWMTPENALKMFALEPSQGQFDFRRADAIVNWALKHGKHVHGHTLIWDQQLPSWLATGSLDKSTALAVMKTYITTVLHHFRGRVDEWDVVNEAIAPDGSWQQSVWYKALGPAYIIDAYRIARAAAPKDRLCYNDAGIETPSAHATAVLKLVRALHAQGLLDCVGFESHFDTPGPSEQALATEIKRFTAAGVYVLISELDVTLAHGGTLAQQAQTYANVAEACRSVSGCDRVTTWGFTDASSWLGSAARALPFNADCRPKPAWRKLETALAKPH